MKKKLNKDLDRVLGARPNVYAFLLEKGVDSKIADEAQEFVMMAWCDLTTKLAEVALRKAHKPAQKLASKAEKLTSAIDDFLDELT